MQTGAPLTPGHPRLWRVARRTLERAIRDSGTPAAHAAPLIEWADGRRAATVARPRPDPQTRRGLFKILLGAGLGLLGVGGIMLLAGQATGSKGLVDGSAIFLWLGTAPVGATLVIWPFTRVLAWLAGLAGRAIPFWYYVDDAIVAVLESPVPFQKIARPLFTIAVADIASIEWSIDAPAIPSTSKPYPMIAVIIHPRAGAPWTHRRQLFAGRREAEAWCRDLDLRLRR
jgi:hypothetical protein